MSGFCKSGVYSPQGTEESGNNLQHGNSAVPLQAARAVSRRSVLKFARDRQEQPVEIHYVWFDLGGNL